MREFSERFVRLGEIAGIKRGITSGCDDFFMPRDVTIRILEEFPNDLAWRNLPAVTAAKREDVVTGEARRD